MSDMKTKTIERIESRMQNTDKDSVRHMVLRNAKSFKESWIGLGQTLYSVWKDKLYREWGYEKFDTYTSKEIGIRKQTALKLLRSYFFLEKEEPDCVRNGFGNVETAGSIPTFEAIDTLRLASNKKLDKSDYINMRHKVLRDGADAREVKKDLTQLMREREELDPDEVREKKREALIKRYVTALKSMREELKVSKMLPAQILNDIDKLLARLDTELSR